MRQLRVFILLRGRVNSKTGDRIQPPLTISVMDIICKRDGDIGEACRFTKSRARPRRVARGWDLRSSSASSTRMGGNVWATNASDGGLIVAMELPLIE